MVTHTVDVAFLSTYTPFRHLNVDLRWVTKYVGVLLNFLVTVKAAPHERVIRTGQR